MMSIMTPLVVQKELIAHSINVHILDMGLKKKMCAPDVKI